jgi:mannose-6-phosphate isomerase-like protein (cupin superfamily)
MPWQRPRTDFARHPWKTNTCVLQRRATEHARHVDTLFIQAKFRDEYIDGVSGLELPVPNSGESTMAEATTDLLKNYLLLEPDGTSVPLPGGGDFWGQVMSGNATDPGVRRLMSSEKGRLVAVLPMSADWTNWEMHPAGDEILFMLEGNATFVFDLPTGLSEIVLSVGRLLVVPKGVWHTARVSKPARLLAITAGLGTQHRPN